MTVAFTKGMADHFNEGGISAVSSSREPYACVAAGLVSGWLPQNASEAGPLTASQPGITLVDPIISTVWGVVVFGEHVTQGPLLAPAPPQAGQDRTAEGRQSDLAGAGS